MKDMIAQWYEWGFWTKSMVQEAVPDLLTQEEADAILHPEEV